MMTIVKTKLTMDKRRVYMNWKQKQQQQENANHLNGVLFFYAVIGVMMALFIIGSSSLFLSMVILHGYVLFMMSMTLITDFSSVLLDTTDNQVLLPKPINSKTLFMARLVHILVYLLQFIIAMAFIPLITSFFKYGIVAGIVLIFTVLLTVLLAVFSTYFLYLIIIRFSSESKVKDIVTYFQIFMAVLFMAGFQILPRIIDLNIITQLFQLHWYSYFFPPVWMAMTVEAFSKLIFDVQHLMMIGLAFIIPIFTFWIMNKYLAPSFAKKLAAMGVGDSEKKDSSKVILQQEKNSLSKLFSNIVCNSPVEKNGFELTWKLTSREKNFKLQFYPSLAYILVLIFIFVFKSGNDINNVWSNLSSSKKYLWFFYIPMIAVNGSIILATFNENYLASWIYHSLPIEKPGQLISGMIKSLFVKFFIPIYIILLIFCVSVWGFPILEDALFALINNFLCFVIFANISQHYLPFSRQPNTQQQSGKFLIALLQILIIGIIVGLHFLLLKVQWPWLIWAVIPVLLWLCFLMINRVQNLKWNQISV